MSKRRRIAVSILGLYVLTLFWGYARLPWAAIKSLRDYRGVVAPAAAVSFDPGLDLSPIQEWYLKWSINESPVPVVPRLNVEVKWNLLILARVQSGHWVSGTGAEGKDCLYFCLFGFWIPVYNFGGWMA